MYKSLPLVAAAALTGCSLSPEPITLDDSQHVLHRYSVERAFVAFASFDVDNIVKYTHESLIDGISEVRYREILAAAAKENAGTKLLRHTLGKSKCNAKKRIVCWAQSRAVIEKDGAESLVRGYMIGISDDDGESWGYLQGSNEKDGIIKKLVPELPSVLPTVEVEPCTPEICDVPELKATGAAAPALTPVGMMAATNERVERP